MVEQVEMPLAGVDPAPLDGARYRCSRCGSTEVAPDPTRPPLDERYVLGFCNRCRRLKTQKAKHQQLIRDDALEAFNRREAEKVEVARKANLMRAYVEGRYPKGSPKYEEGRRLFEEQQRGGPR